MCIRDRSVPGYTIDEGTRSQTVVVNPDDTQHLYFYNDPEDVYKRQPPGHTDDWNGARNRAPARIQSKGEVLS